MLGFFRSLWLRDGKSTYRWADPSVLCEARTAEDLIRSDETLIWYADGKLPRTSLRGSPLAHITPGNRRMLPSLSEVAIEDPPIFAIAASDCRHIGFRTVLAGDAMAFNDDFLVGDGPRRNQAARFNNAIPNTGERTPLRAAEDLSEVVLDSKPRGPVKKISGTTFVLTTDEPTNYGSFLFRATPKLLTLRQMGLEGRILIPAHYPTMRDYLAMLGLNERDYIAHDPDVVYHLERAVVIGNRNIQAHLDRESVELHRAIARRHFDRPTRKLFVSREGLALTKTGYRRMVNADAAIAALRREGFEIIEPEAMSMAAQIEAFATAEFVIGQSGGAMFNCAFCKPGTRVIDIESEPHWIHAHLCFMSSLDLSFSIFEGQTLPCERPYHLPFEVDVDALVDHVRAPLPPR